LSRNCSLPDIDPTDWKSTPADLLDCYMGALPDYASEGQRHDYLRPNEPHDDGCPGGWYRCEFIDSIHQYRRTRAEGGMRADNPLIHKDTDRLLLEAIQYLEKQEEAAMAYFHDCAYGD